MSKKNSFQIGFSAISLLVLMLPSLGHSGFDPARYDERETTFEESALETSSRDDTQLVSNEQSSDEPLVVSVAAATLDRECTQALIGVPQLQYRALGEFNFNH